MKNVAIWIVLLAILSAGLIFAQATPPDTTQDGWKAKKLWDKELEKDREKIYNYLKHKDIFYFNHEKIFGFYNKFIWEFKEKKRNYDKYLSNYNEDLSTSTELSYNQISADLKDYFNALLIIKKNDIYNLIDSWNNDTLGVIKPGKRQIWKLSKLVKGFYKSKRDFNEKISTITPLLDYRETTIDIQDSSLVKAINDYTKKSESGRYRDRRQLLKTYLTNRFEKEVKVPSIFHQFRRNLIGIITIFIAFYLVWFIFLIFGLKYKHSYPILYALGFSLVWFIASFFVIF